MTVGSRDQPSRRTIQRRDPRLGGAGKRERGLCLPVLVEERNRPR